jgi:mobilization protein NikA
METEIKEVKYFRSYTKKYPGNDLRVRLTQEDRQILEQSAILACLSMSEYIRKLIWDNRIGDKTCKPFN